MIRRFSPPPDPSVRYSARPGAYAILAGTGARAGQVLLTETDEVQLPGGGVDPGEGVMAALHREVWEETGHRARALRRLGAFRRFVWMPEYSMHADKLCHVYAGLAGPRVGPPVEPEHTVLWVPAGDVPDVLGVEGDRAFARLWLRGVVRRRRGRGSAAASTRRPRTPRSR